MPAGRTWPNICDIGDACHNRSPSFVLMDEMDDMDDMDDAWREHRQRLLDIAYRMLGSVSDAEDVVQETYARLLRADVEVIDDLRGWLITVTGRLCLDHLRSADVRRRS